MEVAMILESAHVKLNFLAKSVILVHLDIMETATAVPSLYTILRGIRVRIGVAEGGFFGL